MTGIVRIACRSIHRAPRNWGAKIDGASFRIGVSKPTRNGHLWHPRNPFRSHCGGRRGGRRGSGFERRRDNCSSPRGAPEWGAEALALGAQQTAGEKDQHGTNSEQRHPGDLHGQYVGEENDHATGDPQRDAENEKDKGALPFVHCSKRPSAGWPIIPTRVTPGG
jgi:hypothetical protein